MNAIQMINQSNSIVALSDSGSSHGFSIGWTVIDIIVVIAVIVISKMN